MEMLHKGIKAAVGSLRQGWNQRRLWSTQDLMYAKQALWALKAPSDFLRL